MCGKNEAVVLFGKYIREKYENMPSNLFDLLPTIFITLSKVNKVYKNGNHEILVRCPKCESLDQIGELLNVLGCYKLNGKYVYGEFYLSFDCSQSLCWDGFDLLLGCFLDNSSFFLIWNAWRA